MNLTHRNVADNCPPSPGFYCFLKMLIRYLGNEAWQMFRTWRAGFSVEERAPDGAQSWLLKGSGHPLWALGLPSPGLCVHELLPPSLVLSRAGT